MVELPKFWRAGAASPDEKDLQRVAVQRVGVVAGSIGEPERFTSLAALFPNVHFVQSDPNWPDTTSGHLDVLVAPVDAGIPGAVDEAVRRLKAVSFGVQVVVVLRDADVGASRRLVREGAADVLPAPVSEPALALCLERLLSSGRAETAGPSRRGGHVVAFMKAGGGVGATTLAVQAGAMLAARSTGRVGVIDLDLQFGAVGLYLDLPDAVTITECLAAGGRLEDTPFDTALTTHRSGARVLAAPSDMMPMEALAADQIESLLAGLRRDFDLVLIDLPPVWTAWSNRLLELADRIVLVSQLTVPHVNLVKRQLAVLTAQGLSGTPLTVICNALSRDQQAVLSVKAAERSIGRAYDVVVPEDRRLVNAAVNQGLELSGLRRGTQVEKAVTALATVLAGGVSVEMRARR